MAQDRARSRPMDDIVLYALEQANLRAMHRVYLMLQYCSENKLG